MLQPQLIQVLLGSILGISQSATSATTTITANAGKCIAPVAIGRVTLQSIAGPILPRINHKETTTTIETATTTTPPTTAAITRDQAPLATDVEGQGISVGTAPTPTTLGTQEQEGC